MRRRGRVDANHGDVVKALRQIGADVISLAPIGNDVPDLLVGFRARNLLIEVKDGSKSPSERKLSEGQQRFHREWRGQRAVAESAEQAVSIVLGQK